MIAIIDYGMGNLGSVKRKLDRIGVQSRITSDTDEIISSSKIILPGVGYFSKAVSEIKKRGLWELLSEQVLIEKKPVLGICLGMQLMAKSSEEGYTEGLGWFDASVIRFKIRDTRTYKVPHIGWNSIKLRKESSLFKEIGVESEFYFVHSYYVQCNRSEDVVSETDYEYCFTSAICKDNIFGVQFHPEKSHDAGETLLKNFINL